MAGNLINTLYPPIADTFMPAFVNDEDAYILFSLSPYNSQRDVKRIHVTLTDQKTNHKVLDNRNDTENKIFIDDGIMILDINDAAYDSESGLYKITISPLLLKQEFRPSGGEDTSPENYFKIETWYQAQVRLDCCEEDIEVVSQYLMEQRKYFSEWSRVILLRAIPRPIMFFNAWDDDIPTDDLSQVIKYETGINNKYRWTLHQESNPTYNPGLVPIAGRIYWDKSKTGTDKNTEYLDNYRITIYKSGEAETPIVDSGIIYVGNQEKDSIYYLADLSKQETSTSYIIHIDAETRNKYSFWDERTISLAIYSDQSPNLTWEFTTIKLNSYGDTSEKVVTEEDGFVRCRVTSKEANPPGYLYIYRTSSEDNYKKSEIIQVTRENGTIDTTFEDRTVCSLVQYKYYAQYKIKETQNWTQQEPKAFTNRPSIYPDFYDMLLLRQDKQLAIRYDEQISSLKPVVNRVKIDTLGSKYPRFAENARMNYKSFQISGIITAEADFNRRFLNETDDEFKDSLEGYNENIGNIWQLRNDTIIESTDNPIVEGEHDWYLHDNWYWEREFREKAMAWLNDGEPKLFRSMTEGNMIIMLTDVSLTPNKTLGRRIYSFSATAYEIADGKNYEDIVKYGIIKRRDDETEDLTYGEGSSGSDKDYVYVERINQYILTKDKSVSKNIDNSTNIITDQIISIDSSDGGWVDPISIRDYLKHYYEGILKAHQLKDGSIVLKDVKIQFTSKPRWMKINGLDYVTEEPTDTNNLLFGYKFRVTTVNNENRIIFVNQKGYYQIPSDLPVTALSFFYGDAFQIDYILTYKLEYNSSLLPSRIEKVKDIVGQYAGVFYPDTYMGDTIRRKYSLTTYTEGRVATEESMTSWSGVGFDVTPYAVIDIIEQGDTIPQRRLVGRTGVYNLMTSFQIDDFRMVGRRMTKARRDNRPHLDEWEYILDQTVTSTDPSVFSPYWYNVIVNEEPDIIIEPTDNLVYLGLINSVGVVDMRDPIHKWGEIEGVGEEEQLYGYLKINNIDKPQYNTVYKILDQNGENPVYVLYYIDQGWYQIYFEEEDNFDIAIAKVPIYGMINYRGTVLKRTYS